MSLVEVSTKETHEAANIPWEWLGEFEAAARRPLALRMRYALVRTYKPRLGDAPYRSFDTLEEYRESLPRLRALREYWLKK